MSENYKKLKETLEEVFQLDQADLDFGIYRIMNQKRQEITDFLDKKLLMQVKNILTKAGEGEGEEIKKQIEEAIKIAKRHGAPDPENTPAVAELKAKLKEIESDVMLEQQVYNHLTIFFKRYYQQGDFISQRRYKDDTYAIPYQGEEVKLYWANHDQYYIKTSEHFKNFRFKLDNGKYVNFELLEANTEQNNNKAQEGKERRFKLIEEDFLESQEDQVTIYFTYELTNVAEKQDKLNKESFERIKAVLSAGFARELLKPVPTEGNHNRTLLEKKLKEYSDRNTFDYFIHKDLGGFLSRELDFYIKNEILHIDDLNLENENSFKKQLQLISAFKAIANKITAFLAQLENFQKKLWLKKKFVVESHYCITMDRVPKELYEEITKNRKQIEEWVSLFSVEQLEGFSIPLTTEFLNKNPFLVLDTRFFGLEFKFMLLSSLENLDEQTDGLLINSENFQALNLLKDRFKEQIKFVYIDPPYNTEHDRASGKFLYKDNFAHSSWLAMFHDRFQLQHLLCSNNGAIVTSLDDNETHNLITYLKSFLSEKFVSSPFIWKKKAGGGDDSSLIAVEHEYLVPVVKDPSVIDLGKIEHESPSMTAKYNQREADGRRFYWERMDKTSLTYSKSMDYEVECPDGTFIKPDQPDPSNPSTIWRWSKSKLLKGLEEPDGSDEKVHIRKDKNGNWRIYTKTYASTDGVTPRSLLTDPNHGRNREGTRELANIFGKKIFKNPKPLALLEHLIKIFHNQMDGIIADFFAGSATTAQGVINLNRKDGGKRKYILSEMGEYFNSVTKPRIQKIIFSEKWKEGKPQNYIGISHCFKYIHLESYEDTLNNLKLEKKNQQQQLLLDKKLEEEYFLHYMLDIESRESLLNTEVFSDPFNFSLKITENNELKETKVDLVETFNYLIGLVVESLQYIRGFVVIQGHNHEGEKILVIWRNVKERDNKALNEFFEKLDFNPKNNEFDRIYINGDNNLENLKTDKDHWKVVLIEEEFHKRMFDVQDV